MCFACPSLGQSISTGKGWPLLGTNCPRCSVCLQRPSSQLSQSPTLKHRHVEARLQQEHWAQLQSEAGDWGSLLANKLNPYIAPQYPHTETPDVPWPLT